MTDLDQLIAAVTDETLNRAMCYAFFPQRHEHADEDLAHHMMAAQLGSLDAAHRLHTALLPGVSAVVQTNGTVQTVGGAPGWERHTAVSENNPARAWLLAVLRATAASRATVDTQTGGKDER
jgi:hypothetical protein